MGASGRARRGTVLLGLLLLLVLLVIAGVAFGAVRVPPGEVLGAIGRAAGGSRRGLADALVVDIRLPRVVLAALVGAALASAGVLYQALFRNPLADPYILGISSGAGLGATVALVLTAGATAWRVGVVPAAAFAGATVTIVLVSRLAARGGRMEAASLLLAGVAVSYTLAAATSFLLVFSRQSMASVVYWMMGGLTAASWPYVLAVTPMIAVGVLTPLATTRELNVMLLGDERASDLGVPVERFKWLVLASGSLLVAAAVSVSGLIGFVGLMTPHMVRLAFGPDHKLLLPASLLAGASVMVFADLVARTVLAPIEIPVGIVTAVVGGPFFVWLLVRRDGRR